MHFLELTVGDPTTTQTNMLSALGSDAFVPVVLSVEGLSCHHYRVQHATIDGVDYLKSLQRYESRDFEKLFGFDWGCSDFVAGKVVVVRESSRRLS